MPTEAAKHTVILGAGVAGLATGYELMRRGERVTVLEKNKDAGGLARTLIYDDFRFDIGGHRFHSNNPDVVNWLKELLKEDLLTVPRISHIKLLGKFVDYPIKFPNALGIFSIPQAIRVMISYAYARFLMKKKDAKSFEDWVVQRFGWELYKIYFKPYTEKVWGIPTTELSAVWAAARISIPGLGETIRRAIVPGSVPPATAITSFYYPREGFGMICERLEQRINEGGSQVICDATVKSYDPKTNTVVYEVGGQTHEIKADRVISTIPLNFLLGLLPKDSGAEEIAANYNLDYRDIIIVNLALNREQVSQDSWTYFPDPKLTFGRTHEPKNWSPQMVPSPEVTSLAVEIFTSRGERVWEMKDEDIVNEVVTQMDQIGWIKRADLIKGWAVRVPYAYPVYRIGYQEKLTKVRDFLAQFKDLHLVGRTGSFRYMNSDGVIEDVMRVMKELYGTQAARVKELEEEKGRWV